ncbi:MAG: M24 family metallopeptidase [Actinomycetota bacterium]
MFGRTEPITATTRREEVEAKLERLRALLDRRALAAAVLTDADAVAWATGGLTNPIERGAATSPLWLVVRPDGAAGVTTNVERERIDAESGLLELEIPLHDAAWYDPGSLERLAAELAGARRDRVGGLGADIEEDLVELRLALVPPERERLALLAVDAAAALEDALRSWSPGETDFDVQARVSERLERAGAFGACLIVGGDERAERFRHPLAVGAPLERLVMCVLVAERGGLHAAVTRFAAAGELSASVRAARDAARAVEAATLGACLPGATYGDVLAALDRAYSAVGYARGWADHYQGGPIGYRQREFEIVPTQTDSRWFSVRVDEGHALAWNPSVAGGGKVEDTYLVEGDALRRLTDTGAWPLDDGAPAVLDVSTGEAA